MNRDPGACARLAKQQVTAQARNSGAVHPRLRPALGRPARHRRHHRRPAALYRLVRPPGPGRPRPRGPHAGPGRRDYQRGERVPSPSQDDLPGDAAQL